jgi:hypothetical protein
MLAPLRYENHTVCTRNTPKKFTHESKAVELILGVSEKTGWAGLKIIKIKAAFF